MLYSVLSSVLASAVCGDTDSVSVLQCLEAQYYSCAVYGHSLSDDLTGSGPQPIGCQQANFTNDDIYSIAMDVANNEAAHVNYLRQALGNYSVQCPLVNIGDAFSAAADAALNTTLSPAFSPYVNDLYFLTGAFIFEDLGVTAYKGALTSFQSSDIMLAAAGEQVYPRLCPNCSQLVPAMHCDRDWLQCCEDTHTQFQYFAAQLYGTGNAEPAWHNHSLL